MHISISNRTGGARAVSALLAAVLLLGLGPASAAAKGGHKKVHGGRSGVSYVQRRVVVVPQRTRVYRTAPVYSYATRRYVPAYAYTTRVAAVPVYRTYTSVPVYRTYAYAPYARTAYYPSYGYSYSPYGYAVPYRRRSVAGDVLAVAAGAGAGALVGGLVAGKKGALIGAAVGGVGGALIRHASSNRYPGYSTYYPRYSY